MYATPLPQADGYRSTANETIAFFEQCGVAVFPSGVRRKGTYIEGWPAVAVGDAIAATKSALSTRRINVAGRSGNGFAVLDLDCKGGVDAEEMLRALCRLLGPAVMAAVRTSRGYHLWVQVVESVGNGYCTFIGGEIFSGPHLAMLPPSIHPDGHEYTWAIQPREPEAAANLRAIGLVPDKSVESTRSRGRSTPTPAPPDFQEEFARLMAAAGVARAGTSAQALTLCVWHPDRSPSLSINWDAAVFYCFSEQCGARGGLAALRLRVQADDTPSYRQCTVGQSPSPMEVRDDQFSGDKSGCLDLDGSGERLAEALEAIGDERARAVRECRAFFRVGKCGSCARTPAFPISCGHPLCARCMPGRLAADWARHRSSLPPRLTILLLRPRGLLIGSRGVLKTARSRFAEWRKRAGVAAGIYGSRLDPEHGAVIMLAMPSDAPIPISSRAFEVITMAFDRSPMEFRRWLQSQYVAEAQSWESAEELQFLLTEIKGRRRFQGFGAIYGGPSEEQTSGTVEEKMAENGSGKSEVRRRALGRISGGSFSKRHDKGGTACPFCGGAIELYPFAVPASEVQASGDHWLWLGPSAGPPEARRHAR